MADTNVRILVNAIDQASNVLKNIGKNLEASLGKEAQTNVSGLTAALGSASGGFAKLAGAIGTTGLVVGAAVAAVGGLAMAFNKVASWAENTERVMAMTNAVVKNTGDVSGITSRQILQIAQSLSEITPIEDEAIQATENMLASFDTIGTQTLPIATQAVMDLATAVNGGAIPSQEELVSTARSLGRVLQNPADMMGLLRRNGIVLSDSQKELIRTLQDSGRGFEAQKVILDEISSRYGGSAAASLSTYGGATKQLHNSINNLKEAIGGALSPAVQMVAGRLSGAFSAAATALASKLAQLQSVVLVLVGALMILGQVAMGVALTIGAALSGQFGRIPGIVKGTMSGVFATVSETNQRIANAYDQAAQKQKDSAVKGANGAAMAQSAASKKIQKSMADETETYQRELEKRNRAFDQQLGDLIRAHIDKKNKLIQDLAEENSDFNRSMSDRKKEFKEAMDDMKEQHEKKVADIKEAQAEEDTDFNESMAERIAKFKEAMDELEDTHEKKVTRLQRQMEKESKFNDNEANVRFLDLKQELEDENEEYAKNVAKKEAQNAKEMAKEQTQHTKRMAELEKQLTEENELYKKDNEKKLADEAEQTARLQEEHDKRTAALQKQLDAENEILNRHKAEVAAVKDQAVEDDITRLQNQHARENEEALAQHNKKMGDLKTQGEAEGDMYGTSIMAGLSPKYDELVKTAKKAGEDAGNGLFDAIAKKAKDAGEALLKNFISGAIDLAKQAVHKGLELGALGPAGQLYEAWRQGKLPFMQTGGIVPGPLGQPVPIMAHAGEMVTPQGLTGRGYGRGVGSTINFNISIGMYAGTETEKRNIAKKLYSSLLAVANSQHRTVAELMGG